MIAEFHEHVHIDLDLVNSTLNSMQGLSHSLDAVSTLREEHSDLLFVAEHGGGPVVPDDCTEAGEVHGDLIGIS